MSTGRCCVIFTCVFTVVSVTFFCSTPIVGLTCHKHNPYVINGTQPPDELRCPKKCNCTYCKEETELHYNHDVLCSHQQLETIPSQDTVPTDAVYYHLQDNNIPSLKSYAFQNLTELGYLTLGQNKLSYNSIEINAFHGLRTLKYLSMDKNLDLHQLLPWFDDLVSLELLHLQHCGISAIQSDVFTHCKNLKKIDLTYNSITSFNSLFQNLPNLNYLYLHHNRLSSIPPQAFKGSTKLKEMSLNDNFLSTFAGNVGIQNLLQLQSLDVAYNKFSCDCDLVWFLEWLGETNVTITDSKHAQCRIPHSSVYHNLLYFAQSVKQLHCSKLDRILTITIPCASAGLTIVLISVLLYRYRFTLRYWNQRRRLRKQYQRICNQGPPTINGENIRYDVFVCYNSNDQQWVLKTLQPSLELQRNFKLCVDYRDFIPGEAIVTNIANAVKFSRKVLLVVSKHFAKSEWCNFELEMARMRMFDNHEDILIVVLIEKVSPKDMPILLHKILTKKTYIEWEEHPEGQALFWAKLEAALLSPNCPQHRIIDI